MTTMRAVPAIASVAIVLLSGANCRHVGAQGSIGWHQPKYDGQRKEVPGLSLRGTGCHLEVLDSDSSVICRAIAVPVPKCARLNVAGTGADGGMTFEHLSMGSDCPPPRFSSGVIGPGQFFVEGTSGAFAAICDDAYWCQRSLLRQQIFECCRQDKSIQGTAVCKVTPHEGVCVEGDEEEAGNRNVADPPGDAGIAP